MRTFRLAALALMALSLIQQVHAVDPMSRRALLVGVSDYENTEYSLRGPRNDIRIVQSLLTRTLGFQQADVTIVADGVRGSRAHPTRAAIVAAFRDLTQWADTLNGPAEAIVYLSGHGSRQPANDSDLGSRSFDGFDAIFLPRDVGRWDGAAGVVRNVILNSEIRALVDDLRRKGVFVWVIIDSCHAGYAVRGGVRARFIPPEVLGIPVLQTLPKPSATGARVRSVVSTTGTAEEGPWVAFLASRPDEQTVELDLPKDAPATRREVFGLFTYQIVRAVERNPAATFRSLAQEILRAQGTQFPVTPVFEGNGLDRPLSSVRQRQDRRPQWPIYRTRGGDLAIGAGTVFGLGRGSRLSVARTAVDNAPNGSVGDALVTDSFPLESIISVDPSDRNSPGDSDRFVGMVARLEQATVPLSITIAKPDDVDATSEAESSRRARAVIARMARDNRGSEQFRWTRPDAEADVYLELSNGRLILKPSVSASHETENSLQLDLIGLTEADIAKALEAALAKYYRLHNLSRFAQGVTGPELQQGLRVDFRRRKCSQPKSLAERVDSTTIPALTESDCIDLAVENKSDADVCVTALGANSQFDLTVLWPRRSGESNLLEQSGRMFIDSIAVDTTTVGRESIVLLAASLVRGRDCAASGYDFSFIAQDPVRSAGATSFAEFAARLIPPMRGFSRQDKERTPAFQVRFYAFDVKQ